MAVVLGLASAAATLYLFPYLQLLIPEQIAQLPARLWVVALAQSAQSGILCTFLAWLGLTVGAPYGLDAPWIRAWTERPPRAPAIRPRWLLAVLCGAFAGALVAGLSLLWPDPSSAAATGEGFSWMWRGALAAFLFGIGHLPAAVAAGVARAPLQGTRIVVLNMLAGIVFGALYWKVSLEHAMVAHFCADLVLHVALPALPG